MQTKKLLILSILFLVIGAFQIKGMAQEGLKDGYALDRKEIEYLKRVEKATFSGFEKLFDQATWFPVDIASVAHADVLILSENTYYSKTSPTNIGLGFLYLILAKERGYLSEKQAYARALRMMDMLEQLETHEGFLYNWYYLSGKDGRIPQVTLDRFVSSLDNGDLDICLMATAGAFAQTELSRRIDKFLGEKDYHFFFNKNPDQRDNGMINVGYDDAKKIYHAADYSIFNVEGRMTVLVAILKDNIPESAWRKQARLVRTYTTLENEMIPVVAAWGGSLYETLFADEILGGFEIAPKAFQQNALRAKASVKLLASEKGDSLIEVQYDVKERYTYSGVYIKYDDLDVSKYRSLIFQVRGDQTEGYPKTIKAELKWHGEYVQFEHLPLKSMWAEVQIAIPKDSKSVDELTFVIENSAAGEHQKGAIFIRALVLR